MEEGLKRDVAEMFHRMRTETHLSDLEQALEGRIAHNQAGQEEALRKLHRDMEEGLRALEDATDERLGLQQAESLEVCTQPNPV